MQNPYMRKLYQFMTGNNLFLTHSRVRLCKKYKKRGGGEMCLSFCVSEPIPRRVNKLL